MRQAGAILLFLLLATPASARGRVDSSPAGITARVRKHLKSAKTHFELGELDQAALEWKRAYKLRALPVLLFNMGQAYRLAGHYAEARFAYETYLHKEPGAPNKAETEGRIRTMTRYIHHPPKHGPIPAKPSSDG